jgi:plasmid stability protein
MVQIRNMPEDIHRKMKSRAALAGMSLSDYLLQEVRKVAEMPTMEEMRERLARLPAVTLSRSPTEILREERDRRDTELFDRR